MATKLTTEEIQKLTDLQNSQAALVQELGQIELIKLNLSQRREAAEEFLTQLKGQEEEIAQELNEKYGSGSINLQTGEFEPAPQQETLETEESKLDTASFK